MIRPLYADPFNPTLRSSEVLDVSIEQRNLIRQVLDYSSSDSMFAKKAYDAIQKILTQGSVLLPVINSLSPDSVQLGSESFDIHVMGEGFDVDATIVWNELDEPTVRVSDSELTTGVNMGTANNAVGVPVMVRNGSGVLSNAMTFTFLPADGSVRLTDAERERIKTNNEANKKAHIESPGVFENNLIDRGFLSPAGVNDKYKRDPKVREVAEKNEEDYQNSGKETKEQMFLPFEESNKELKKSIENPEEINRNEEMRRLELDKVLEGLRKQKESHTKDKEGK